MTTTNNSVTSIIIAGVGGQGSILTSHLLSQSALRAGYEVKLAETFGAATRGGSVLAHIRIGDVWSPTIGEDEADAIVSLEPLEGLRVAAKYLRPGGWALINDRPLYPVDVTSGRAKYPTIKDIVKALISIEAQPITLDASTLAIQAGDVRSINSVLLGGLFALDLVPIDPIHIIEAMKDRWSDKLVKINKQAFSLGLKAVQSFIEG